MNVHIMVAIPRVTSAAPDEKYNYAHFKYDSLNDTYTCPKSQVLTTNGNWHQKSKERYLYMAMHYKMHGCTSCPAREMCTKNQKGRLIERSEYARHIAINRDNIEGAPLVYKKRQSIVEHPYGTIKRQWGFDHIITKRGLKRASVDAGFIFVAYNLRRLINIIDKKCFKEFLHGLALIFFVLKVLSKSFMSIISHQIIQHQIGWYFSQDPAMALN